MMGPNKDLVNHIEIRHYWRNRLGRTWRDVDIYDRDWRFYYNTEPGALLTFRGTEISLEPKTYYLIPPLTALTGKLVPGTNPLQYFIHFRTGAPHSGIARGVYPFPLKAEIEEDLRLIAADLDSTAGRGSAEGILTCLALIARALGEFSTMEVAEENRDRRILHIMEQLEKNCGENKEMERLAAEAGLSRSGMIRLFKKEAGCTPYRYLTMKRMEKAVMLMENRNLSLEEISESCGFCDRFQFSKSFKAVMNISPGEFRKYKLGSQR